MINWTITTLIAALIAFFFGFNTLSTNSVNLAQNLFYIFITMLGISIIIHVIQFINKKEELKQPRNNQSKMDRI